MQGSKSFAINPEKSFRVIVRNAGQYRTVVNRAIKWGFMWIEDVTDSDVPFAVLFFPNADGSRIIRRQMSRYDPGSNTLAYSQVKKYSFEYFSKSNLRFKQRKSSKHCAYPVKAIPVKCTSRVSNEVREFCSSLEAVNWLKENGHPNARRHAIYQCIQPFNRRNSAYGYKWEKAE